LATKCKKVKKSKRARSYCRKTKTKSKGNAVTKAFEDTLLAIPRVLGIEKK